MITVLNCLSKKTKKVLYSIINVILYDQGRIVTYIPTVTVV